MTTARARVQVCAHGVSRKKAENNELFFFLPNEMPQITILHGGNKVENPKKDSLGSLNIFCKKIVNNCWGRKTGQI